MKVLIVASESVPFIKTGGLADVIGSLPKALKDKNIDVRVMLPLYKDIIFKYGEKLKYKTNKNVQLSWRSQYCGIFEMEYDGVIFYFIDNEYYFKRDGVYGYYDDAERFAFYSKAVLDVLPILDFKPDILHCHDWHTGLVSVFLKTHYMHNDFYKNMKTLFTIHNLHYQGVFSKDILRDILDLGEENFTIETLEYSGAVNCMKGGIVFSDLISTVSKTYAKEITYPYFGEGLDGILRKREGDLRGIVNGIDEKLYDPQNDPYIYHNYNLETIENKVKNKLKLQEELSLNLNENTPIISIVSRLVDIKGMDLVIHVIEEIMNTLDVQIVILGTGDKVYEDTFKYMEYKYSGRISANIMFNNELANKVYASSDMLLMPSRLEPCGLSQLIALRYGTIPIVRETGGLNDTVKFFNKATGEGNGFTFKNFNAHDMLFTIKKAIDTYRNEDMWNKIISNAMKEDYSWDNSALEYIELYNKLAVK
ncbi:glycogen synthase GlgA [Gottschalkia acidurici 9a]|uniref:Glycogen synthase n=1 Tax=Gottschalkia acidurici (strain ATCC 7906 / DSM 604 / BCRC 14475 / CIP 104303 / KCTC 5404 / NCIMB 10678 / 9a) TaxID=1128398 RepID=K0AUW9_GOTA9|nr:glycogen synthase GlgA [Gottschalkia acidurici]AFS77673.1 glycogen synthase GlgA [Gottschalkia acidurici 9a]